MSGKRQHFIPRFLLEGFASHMTGKEVFTWVYRKGQTPFNTNIINVGVEGHFYSDENDAQADEMITQAEERFSLLVQRLRSTSATAVSDIQLPELIAHFEIRTRHLRENFLRTGHYLVSRFIDFIADDRLFIQYLERSFRNDPALLRKSFADEFEKRGLPKQLLEPTLRMSSHYLPFMMDRFIRPMLPELALHLRSAVPTAMIKGAKSGQLRFFKERVSPPIKIERYNDLTYQVVDMHEGGLILGDSIILFQLDGPRPFKTFLEKTDVLSAVFLPLSPRKFLVGTCHDLRAYQRGLPEAIARCSLEFFVADEHTDKTCSLQREIAEDAHLLTREQLEDIITEVLKG